MKLHLVVITALFFILVASGCQKKPSASFDINKEAFSVLETVSCSSTSENAYSLSWVVRGPQEFRSTNSEFSFTPSIAGNYEITLACYSKNNKKVSKTSKNIVVTNVNSQYTFYSDNIYGTSIKILVDGVYRGNITQEYSFDPPCGSSTTGCVTVTLSPGSHSMQAVLASLSKNYVITANQITCNPFLVSF